MSLRAGASSEDRGLPLMDCLSIVVAATAGLAALSQTLLHHLCWAVKEEHLHGCYLHQSTCFEMRMPCSEVRTHVGHLQCCRSETAVLGRCQNLNWQQPNSKTLKTLLCTQYKQLEMGQLTHTSRCRTSFNSRLTVDMTLLYGK